MTDDPIITDEMLAVFRANLASLAALGADEITEEQHDRDMVQVSATFGPDFFDHCAARIGQCDDRDLRRILADDSGTRSLLETILTNQARARQSSRETAARPRTMRVPIKLVIEVDPAAWADTYGTDTSAKAVSDDVRSYVLTSLQGTPGALEAGMQVTVVR